MEIKELEEILRKSWSKETCSPGLRESYSEENRSLGQCAITAMIVKGIFGGKIMRCMASTGSHYYNMIDGKIVDLTVAQFLGKIPQYEQGEERTMEYLLSNEDTKDRYLKLLNWVIYYMSMNNSPDNQEKLDGIKRRKKEIEKQF